MSGLAACPEWCTLPNGHQWEFTGLDDDELHFLENRYHEGRVASVAGTGPNDDSKVSVHVALCALETVTTTVDGVTSTLSTPAVSLWADTGDDMTGSQAREVAAALQRAAERVEEVSR